MTYANVNNTSFTNIVMNVLSLFQSYFNRIFILYSLCFRKDVIFKEPTIKTNDPKTINIGHQTKDK